MYHNYDALKLIIEEQHREQMNLKYGYRKLDWSEDSRIKTWIKGQFGELLEILRRPSITTRLFRSRIQTTQEGFEINECQAPPDCQPC